VHCSMHRLARDRQGCAACRAVAAARGVCDHKHVPEALAQLLLAEKTELISIAATLSDGGGPRAGDPRVPARAGAEAQNQPARESLEPIRR